MTFGINDAKDKLSLLPRAELGFFPTPMHKLERLSKQFGVNLYIKRDDFTGKNLFGGNKTRKLEFLIGKAIEEECEYIFTYGATQSNHAMQTAWTATANNLKAVLYLVTVVGSDSSDLKSNLLLNKIFDAEIHIIEPDDGESLNQAAKRAKFMGAEHIKRLEADGHKCMNMAFGGADETGVLGYISGFVEIAEQTEKMGLSLDYLYHASGTGGTMAGLVAGKKQLGAETVIKSILVMDTEKNHFSNKAKLANKALQSINCKTTVYENDFNLETGFYAPGYECPNKEANEAIKLLAKEEGILLDPVYTGKAFAGLIHDIRSSKIAPGSDVVFLHTGGATALFAEKEILGDLV